MTALIFWKTDIILRYSSIIGAKKEYNKYAVLHRIQSWSEEVISAYHERPSMRDISRIFCVSRQTIASYLKILLPAQDDDALEINEMYSYALKKSTRRWLWIAMCCRTSQIVTFVLGDRSEVSYKTLRERILSPCKTCRTFSDFWSAYSKIGDG